MIRRPPRSTLFPYRRSSDLSCRRLSSARQVRPGRGSLRARTSRSEEHTSELQSHHDLVCRLLLEKKKRTITIAFRYELQAQYLARLHCRAHARHIKVDKHDI